MSNAGRFSKPNGTPPTPKGLCQVAAAWRESMAEEFVFENHHFTVLDVAAWAMHRSLQAREILEAEGLVVTDAKGKPLPHPCISVERDSDIRFMRAMRELNIDVSPEESRPPGVRQFSRRK